jgi:hypothetical protein
VVRRRPAESLDVRLVAHCIKRANGAQVAVRLCNRLDLFGEPTDEPEQPGSAALFATSEPPARLARRSTIRARSLLDGAVRGVESAGVQVLQTGRRRAVTLP